MSALNSPQFGPIKQLNDAQKNFSLAQQFNDRLLAEVQELQSEEAASVADQAVPAATTAVITDSLIVIPASKMQIRTVLRWRVAFSKTAAGVAASTISVLLGTTGTVADAVLLTFVIPAGTAVADVGGFEITCTVRGPLTAACIMQGQFVLWHNGNTVGITTVPSPVLNATSAAFDVTVANLIASLSCTTGAAVVFTFQQVIGEGVNL